MQLKEVISSLPQSYVEDNYVPYVGADQDIDLGSQNLTTLGNITAGNLNIGNWDTAFGWGDHSLVGYLTVELDPLAVHKDGSVDLTGDWTITGNDIIFDSDLAGIIFGDDLDSKIAWDDVASLLAVTSGLKCGGAQSGQSIIASGLVVNDGGGGAAQDDFRVETDNEPNALVVDASADEILGKVASKWGDGGIANYVEISTTGDMTFVGTAGLNFGSCSMYHGNWTQAAAQDTWYNVVDADFIDGQLNNVTHDGNGKLTVAKAGKYLCNVSTDGEVSAANKHVEIGFEVNGSGSAATEGIVCREISGANQELVLSTTAILDLAAGETLEVCVRTIDAGNPTIKVDCVSLNCTLIGGT